MVARGARPKSLEIHAFDVGFGDCFLLKFRYRTDTRNVLIDFGSTASSRKSLAEIAAEIEHLCDGILHAVVATHRHKDHIAGFARNARETGPGDIIRRCADAGRAVVIQPWTENPKAPASSRGPRAARTRQLYLHQLDQVHEIAESITSELRRNMRVTVDVGEMGDDEGLSSQAQRQYQLNRRLAAISENNVKNRAALDNLSTMGADSRYVFFGADAGLSRVLPGVTVHVLGPPTVEQYDRVLQQRGIDPEEFWMLRDQFWSLQAVNGRAYVSPSPQLLFPAARVPRHIPRHIAWTMERLRGARARDLLSLVTSMDRVLNNTSVILLFEAGGKKLLFPGDAQIENWEFALDHPDPKTRARIHELLADVDVYKVGHHGSRNATPRGLWNRFTKRSLKARTGKMTTILSTKVGVHGGIERHTEVPRRTLVAALRSETNLIQPRRGRREVVVFDLSPTRRRS